MTSKTEILEEVARTRVLICGDLQELLEKTRTQVMLDRDAALAVNKELRDELQTLRPLVRKHADEILRLRAERDELLNACRDALNNLPADGECAAFIRAAIAKATGEKLSNTPT